MNTTAYNKLLLFDGVCNLCSVLVQFVIKRDAQGKLKFAPLQSDAAREILNGRSKTVDMLDTVLYMRNGTLLEKSTAVLWLLRDIGGAWQLMFGFMVVPKPVRDWCYDRVARNRYRLFGQRDACMIPTPELSSRFLG